MQRNIRRLVPCNDNLVTAVDPRFHLNAKLGSVIGSAMALIKNNEGRVDIGDLLTLGQAIDWIKGYRLGEYDNIGSNYYWGRQQVVDLMKDGGGQNPMIEVSQSGTPIPAYVFYSEDAIANLSEPELNSLFQFASTTHPISAEKYWHTDEQWQSKPFVSINWHEKRHLWPGARPEPYASVQRSINANSNIGPEMPMGKFGNPDTTSLRREIIKSELTRPVIVSVTPDSSSQNFNTWIWKGPTAVPKLDTPKDVKVTSVFRTSSATGASFSSDIQDTTELSSSVKSSWETARNANAKKGPAQGISLEGGFSSKNSIEAQVASSWKRYSQNKSSRDFKEETFSETKREEQFTDQDFEKIDWAKGVITLTPNEYYERYGAQILARPEDPVTEVSQDGKLILISGATITYGKETLIAYSRSSLVTEVEYTGSALGSFFQGFNSYLPTSYTQLFVSNKNVSRTAANAPKDQKLGDQIAFTEWLKRDGKNLVGKIYSRLQSLNFVDRIWGQDIVQDLEIGENDDGSSRSRNYELISAPSDNSLKAYTIKPLESTTEIQRFILKQEINGKDLKEYVLDRARSEGKLVPEVEDSTMLESLQNLSGRTEQVSSNGLYELEKKVKNTSVDLTNIDNAFIDLGKDLKSDFLSFENTPTRAGAITINHYDPHRDSVTGKSFKDATWSVDYSTKIITASLAQDEESGIQFDISFVIPIDKFKKKNGRFVEKSDSEYSLDRTVRALQASTSPVDSVDRSPYMKTSPELHPMSINAETDLLL